MSSSIESNATAANRFYRFCAVGLLIVVAIATAASWHQYPMFIDTYYHMATIEGFAQANGVTTRAFWEMAPGGRVHVYPPALHVIGYFFSLLGLSPGAFMMVVSGTCYVACLATTWLWLRSILGERAAFFSVALLCGPWGFYWNQATFQALAAAMVIAPLALLALEKERFLACGVLNFVTATMHPMGLFLPPALVINTLLRAKRPEAIDSFGDGPSGGQAAAGTDRPEMPRALGNSKRLVAGLLAASLPVALYGPWLAHIWANRAFLPESRTGAQITLSGVGGASLGLLLVPLAVLALPWLLVRRGPALGLIGAFLGFAVVFPMGFGGRFLSFNIHWPLAGLAGFGLDQMLRCLESRQTSEWWAKHFGSAAGWLAQWIERHVPLQACAHMLAFVVVATALVAYPAVNVPLGRFMPGQPFAPPPPPVASNDGPEETDGEWGWSSLLPNWVVSVQAAALPKIFESSSGMGSGPGMGPMGPSMASVPVAGGPIAGGNFGPGPWARPWGMAPPSAMVPPLGMGFGPGMSPPPWIRGGPPDGPSRSDPAKPPAGAAQTRAPTPAKPDRTRPAGGSANSGLGGLGRPNRGPGLAMPGANVLRNPDAQEFFDAIRAHVRLGDVIHIDEPGTANLITGVTGRWTSNGILRDVRSENARARPEQCDFAVILGGFSVTPGPGGPWRGPRIPSNFEKIFENAYGTLYRNPGTVEHARKPLAAEVDLPRLAVIALVGVLLVLVDLRCPRRRGIQIVAAAAGVIAVSVCLLPLAQTAAGELHNTPHGTTALGIGATRWQSARFRSTGVWSTGVERPVAGPGQG